MKNTNIKQKLDVIIPYIGLVLVLLIFVIATGGGILEARNLNLLINQCFTLLIVSCGLTFVYAHGGMDFSVGSVIGLAAMLAGLAANAVGSLWVVFPICIIVAVGCALITGLITVKLGLPPFIGSLCMKFLCKGVVVTVLATNMVGGLTDLKIFDDWSYKLPVLIIFICVLFILMRYSLIGKYNRMMGENIIAVEQAGVHVNRYKLVAYAISGFSVGLAAFFYLSRTGLVSTNIGNNLELQAIIALTLGGMSLSGGIRSSIRGAIVGSVIMTIITMGLPLVGVSDNFVNGVTGALFLVVVYVSYRRNKKGLLVR